MKTLAQDTIIANARFFGGNVDLVPKQVKIKLTRNIKVPIVSRGTGGPRNFGRPFGPWLLLPGAPLLCVYWNVIFRRWRWELAPWWTPRRFSFSSLAPTRLLLFTRFSPNIGLLTNHHHQHLFWVEISIATIFVHVPGNRGGCVPHVDRVCIPAAPKHHDYRWRGENFSWYYFSSFERLFCSKLMFSCTKDATLELRVRTVKYFKDMWQVSWKHNFYRQLRF